ncbi:hypothetical protein Plhal304r1_c008g0033001 [Plasmopara halstedii]
MTVPNGQRLIAVDAVVVRFRLVGGTSVILTDVLRVLQIKLKLVSISALRVNNIVVQFQTDHASLRFNGNIVAKIPRVDKLFPCSLTQELGEEEKQA